MQEWECLNCGAKHDRDENAAINILVAGGQSETLNGRGGKYNPPPSPPGRVSRGVCGSACVSLGDIKSGALRQQNVNPPKSFGSVGISAPLGWRGCQESGILKLLSWNLFY